MAQPITQKSILTVLIGGFALVILLLLTGGFIGLRNIQSIRGSAAELAEEQLVTNRLLDEVQRQQASLGQVFSVLARDPDSVDAESILAQLDETDQNMRRIAQAGLKTSEKELWERLEQASQAFSAEARRLLTAEDPETFASRDLFRRHEQVISLIARLISRTYHRAIAAQDQIDRRSQELEQETVVLLGTCLLLALIFTVVTVRTTARLFRSMERQADELSRVSWHMLDNQETTARRFSHELHDELGQSLTAVKANLATLDTSVAQDRERLADCFRLVDEAIGNVRQLSQLLRPTILDDFGLAAGLRWLCDGFAHRTGVDVEFQSDVEARFPDETETHLFRIAQEALTNVARHSGASKVRMSLEATGGELHLGIRDYGRGFRPDAGQAEGMGMIGMRARARSAGGDLTVRSRPGEGVAIDVRVPTQGSKYERQDPHLVG